jgi:hypothetical protein
MSEHPEPDDPFAFEVDGGASDEKQVPEPAPAQAPAQAPEPAPAQVEAQAAPTEEEAYDVPIGGTDAGIACNSALRSLARAARSFLLYEPRNKAIRDFLADYRDSMSVALSTHGIMTLEIRPFEMVRDKEVVYLERERERSLAFRLFRDGVRSLTIEPEVEWSELLRLLEILSVRYTGIRQQEDDIVTLLWKAGFKHIAIVAVEGFVPDEEQPAGGFTGTADGKRKQRRRSSAAHIEAPHDWDLPIPALAEPKTLVYKEVTEEQLVALRQEVSSRTMPDDAVRLIARLLEIAADPTDTASIGDFSGLIGEIRDFLLSEGQLVTLTKLATVIEQHHHLDPDLVGPILSRFSDSRALRRILGSIGKAVETVPPELLNLLDMIPSDHLEHLADLLADERAPASRRITRMLIERYLERTKDPSFLMDRLRDESPGVMADLLRAVSHVMPEAAMTEAVGLAGHPASEVQLEVIWVLGRSDDVALVDKVLTGMLKSSFEEVRIRVLGHVELYGGEDSFQMLVEYAQHRSTRRMSHRECEATGTTMAAISPSASMKVFTDWIKPPGLFKRMVEMPGAQALQWTAVTGISLLSGDKVDKLIWWLADRSGEDLYKHCMVNLVRRRREGKSRE